MAKSPDFRLDFSNLVSLFAPLRKSRASVVAAAESVILPIKIVPVVVDCDILYLSTFAAAGSVILSIKIVSVVAAARSLSISAVAAVESVILPIKIVPVVAAARSLSISIIAALLSSLTSDADRVSIVFFSRHCGCVKLLASVVKITPTSGRICFL